jgi:hypothetical protein
MDDEHMEAWQKLKKHLMEHQKNLLLDQELILETKMEAGREDYDNIGLIIKDIDDSIDKVEELFIC